MAGKLVIWRITNPGSGFTEASTSDKVEMDGGAVPDGKTDSQTFSFSGGRRKTDVENAFSNVTNKPDSGLGGIFVTITGIFDETVSDALAIAKLRDWLIDGTVTEAMPNGQIGLRNDKKPQSNLVPSLAAGWKLSSFDYDDDERNGFYIPFTIVLEFLGDPSKLKTGG